MPPEKNIGYGRGIVDNKAPASPTGRIFVVGSSSVVAFNDVQRMFSPDTYGKIRYYSTLAAAIAATAANRGDVIYVLPGHAENITAATGFNASVAGVSIIGCGTGSYRPTFTFTTATSATFTVSAANVTIQNVIFDGTGFDAVAALFTLTSAAVGFSLLDSTVILANATNQATLGLSHTTANNLTIQRCRFQGTSDAGTTAAVQFIAGNDHIITDNVFIGAYTAGTGAISNITTAALRAMIARNVIINLTASSTKGVTLVSGTTGEVADNRFGILSGTAPITGAGAYWLANYYAASTGSVGILA